MAPTSGGSTSSRGAAGPPGVVGIMAAPQTRSRPRRVRREGGSVMSEGSVSASPGVACIVCSTSGPFRRRTAKDGYGIEECPGCGLVQLVPTPTAETLRALYEQESYFGGDGGAGYSQYESQEAEYLATFREDVRRIAEFVPRGRILEVGCGTGTS